MKVFISWSGETSRLIAAELFEWLPMVIQSVQPYMSAESIEKGTRWASSIANELDGTTVGIVVLTPDNLTAPWINFEAGALAKVVEDSRLAPILFGLKPSDVGTPLSQFQVTQFTQDDMLKLLKSINSCAEGLPDLRLQKMHDALWADLRDKIEPHLSNLPKALPVVNGSDKADPSPILEELLVLVRQQASVVHSPEKLLTPDVIRMIVEIALDRGLSGPDQERLRHATGALRRRWRMLWDQAFKPEQSVPAELLETAKSVDLLIEDIVEQAHSSSRRRLRYRQFHDADHGMWRINTGQILEAKEPPPEE